MFHQYWFLTDCQGSLFCEIERRTVFCRVEQIRAISLQRPCKHCFECCVQSRRKEFGHSLMGQERPPVGHLHWHVQVTDTNTRVISQHQQEHHRAEHPRSSRTVQVRKSWCPGELQQSKMPSFDTSPREGIAKRNVQYKLVLFMYSHGNYRMRAFRRFGGRKTNRAQNYKTRSSEAGTLMVAEVG